MFDLSQTFNVLEIITPYDAVTAPDGVLGGEYFNYFFTISIIWGLFCFGVKALVRLMTRT
jgi:hypothetical protein